MMSNVIEMYRAPATLPPEVKAVKGWLLWKLEQHHGEKKPRKVPYYIDGKKRSGIQGSAADREGLATYDRACFACEKGGYAGIGLALLPEWGITAVDFDAVIGADGAIDPLVTSLVSGTYSEISPSGSGVRAFFLGTAPGNRKDNAGSPQVEFFTSKGFVTVTGNPTPICEVLGNEETIAPLTAEVLALYVERFGQGAGAYATPAEEIDPHLVAEMLDKIDPDSGHDVWFRVGLGLHHQFGPSGFDLWNSWSSRGKKYPGERTLRTRWKSIRNDDANPVTINTVRQYATAAGWVEDMSGEFSPIIVEAGESAEAPLPPLARDGKGRIEATVGNLNAALRHDGLCGMRIAYDEFRDEIMLSRDQGANWLPFKDGDYVELRIRLEQRGFKPIGRELVRDVVGKVAEDNSFDSARLWLMGLSWDGIPRLGNFFSDFFGTIDNRYTQAVGRYIWTAMAGRILQPGIKADMVPILIGDQGLLKSTAVAAMVPARDFFCEIAFGEKEADLSRKMRGRLVAEIGELRGLHTVEIERIKAFITRTHEDWTPKFKEFNTVFPRRLVFMGTTNQPEFLADETGNRRFLPLQVHRADVDGIEAMRDQLWAEARDAFLQDGVAWRDAEQLARDQHQAHMITDSWEEVVADWLQQTGPDGLQNSARKYLRTNDLLKFAIGLETRSIGRREELRIGKVLRALGYRKIDVRHDESVIKGWVLQV